MFAQTGLVTAWKHRRGWTGSSAAVVLWPLALAYFANLVLRSYTAPRVIGDFQILYDGAVRLADRQSVYADPFFLLTPSGLFAVGPFGLLAQQPAFLLWNTLSLVATLVGVICAVRFAGCAFAGPVGAAALLVLTLSESLMATLMLGNLNNSLLLASGSGFLLAMRDRRPVLAGILLGLSLAVKPVLVLVLLVLVLWRSWRALAWAIAIPAVLNLIGLALTPFRGDFWAVAVPNLLVARQGANSSLWAVATYLGAPAWTVALLRLLVLGVALAGVWRLRSHADPVLRLGISYGLLLLATFLSSSLAQGYYSMLLMPLLLTAVREGSPMRNPISWVGVYLFLSLDSWAVPELPGVSTTFAVAHWTLGWLVLFAVLATWALVKGDAGSRDTAPAEDMDGEQLGRRLHEPAVPGRSLDPR